MSHPPNLVMILAMMFVLGTITFLYRYAFISPLGKKWVEKIPTRFLQLLAPATFAAIVMNSLNASAQNPEALKPRILVALASLIVAFLTKNILVTLVFGLSLLYFLTSVHMN